MRGNAYLSSAEGLSRGSNGDDHFFCCCRTNAECEGLESGVVWQAAELSSSSEPALREERSLTEDELKKRKGREDETTRRRRGQGKFI